MHPPGDGSTDVEFVATHRFRTEECHYRPPFLAVRSDTGTEDGSGDYVRDLMGHGTGSECFMVFGKELHVITHHRPFPVLESYHAGRHSPEIEPNLDRRHCVTEMVLCPL